MSPSMRKVRIFCCDPDATDSSDDEDDQKNQNSKKEKKKLIREVLVPIPLEEEPSDKHSGVSSDDDEDYQAPEPKKEKKLIGGASNPKKKKKGASSRFPGVRHRTWGSWQAEIRNPFTKKKECTTHKTEEEAAAAYQAKREKYDAMKAGLPVPKCTALSSSSPLSCTSSTSMSCKQEVQNAVGVPAETGPAPTDESVLDKIDGLHVSNSATPADEPSPRDEFQISDFMGAMHDEPLDDDDDHIGLADISHLPLPFEYSELLDLSAEPDWSCFDNDSIDEPGKPDDK